MRVSFHNQLPVRLAGIILLMGFVAVPLVSELRRRAVERIVLQQAEIQAATATIAVVEGLQDVLSSVETTVRTFARDLEDRDLSREAVDRILHNTIAGNPNLSECSISFEPYAFSPADRAVRALRDRSDTQPATRDLAAPEYQYWTREW